MTLTDPRDRLINVADPEHIIQPEKDTPTEELPQWSAALNVFIFTL